MENNVNERISRLIKELKLSKNAFGISIGKSSSTINFIVDGKSKPSFEVLDAICNKYSDLNPSWLLKGEGEMWQSAETGSNSPAIGADLYLQSYLEKLEEQFKRIVNQLETKDMQIQSLTEMLKMTLGKSEDVIIFKTTPVLELWPGAGALEAVSKA